MSVYSSGCVNSSINSNLTVLSGTNSLFISFGYTGIMRCLIGRFPALLLQLTNQLLSRNLSVPVILVNLIPPSFNVVVHDTEYQLLTSCLILMCNLHGNHLLILLREVTSISINLTASYSLVLSRVLCKKLVKLLRLLIKYCLITRLALRLPLNL